MGKFYEFFHMDAVTAASECGLRYKKCLFTIRKINFKFGVKL